MKEQAAIAFGVSCVYAILIALSVIIVASMTPDVCQCKCQREASPVQDDQKLLDELANAKLEINRLARELKRVEAEAAAGHSGTTYFDPLGSVKP